MLRLIAGSAIRLASEGGVIISVLSGKRGGKFLTFSCCCLALLAGATACHKQAEVRSDIVAQVGEVPISAESLQRLMNLRAGGDTNQFSTVEAKAALLDELIRREAVLAKARAAGFDQRPDIQESVKQLIAGKFVDEQLKSARMTQPVVSAAEIEQFYTENQEKYQVAAKARGNFIFLKMSHFATPEKREQARLKAQGLLEKAKSDSEAEFKLLVQNNSEDQATRYTSGDTGWLSGSNSGGLPAEVGGALFSLKTPGEFAPVVETTRGFYIVKLAGVAPAGIRPLAEVRDAITYKIQQAKRAGDDEKFYLTMRAGLDIRTNTALLESIRPAAMPATFPGIPGAVAQH